MYMHVHVQYVVLTSVLSDTDNRRTNWGSWLKVVGMGSKGLGDSLEERCCCCCCCCRGPCTFSALSDGTESTSPSCEDVGVSILCLEALGRTDAGLPPPPPRVAAE